MTMANRKIAGQNVNAVGLGCMNLSHAYGIPPETKQGIQLIQTAFDLGVNHFDTAILYGFGSNETLVGKAIQPFRDDILLASKCGLTTPDLKRKVDGRPDAIKRACEGSLKRMNTEVIDLYYLHRLDKTIPIEDSVGALKELIKEGKIKSIGLSEVSAETLRKAHKVHPIAAVQTEYSLWTRNPELNVLKTCKEIGAAFVAFSPLGRGMLTGTLTNPPAFTEKDLRNNMPRFQEPFFAENLKLIDGLMSLAKSFGHVPAQLALAWLLKQDENLTVIPGTTNLSHLRENCQADQINLTTEQIQQLDALINQKTVQGQRYNEKTQLEIDTEEFSA